ncbi:MAG: MG2 domain-containing protein [Verrucomicrobiales bacterium]|nr:MG2 domain-containing protein [Verrucomicrobiales bacterium]
MSRSHSTIIHTCSLLLTLFALTLGSTSNSDAAPAAPTVKKLSFQRSPSYYSSYSNPLTPTPTILLRFNAPIEVKDSSSKIYFSNKNTPSVKIPAKISRPTVEQCLKLQPYPKNPQHLQNLSTKHFLTVQALSPLPTGHRWSLVIAKGLRSSDQSTINESPLVSRLGRLREFSLNNAFASHPYDSPLSIQLSFNKKLHTILTAATLSQYLKISPQPTQLRFLRHRNSIEILGDLHYDRDYQVTVTAGLPAADQTLYPKSSQHTVRFTPNAPFVHLPAFNTAQNLAGNKNFPIIVGNTDQTLIQIKKLDGVNLIYALRGYSSYLQRSGGIPFEMVPGRTIYKKNWQQNLAIDHSEKIDLNWDSLVKSQQPGAYYLCAEGDSKINALDDAGAQALIQLTDIGLAWKKSSQQTLLYIFSHRSGRPLPGATITLFDNDATKLQQYQSNEQGISTFDPNHPQLKNHARWLEIRFENDRHVLEIDNDMDTLGLWRFNMPYRRQSSAEQVLHRRSLLFTDRPVYKPGDTVHLKCLTRLTDDQQLLTPNQDGGTAKVTLFDSQHRTLVTRDVEVSAHGSIDQSFQLPDNTLGRFQIRIDFNHEKSTERQKWRNIFTHSFQVAEYRPNTFAIKLNNKKDYQLPNHVDDAITIPVSASYLMGKTLSSARLRWQSSAYTHFPYNENFEDFTFGDHSSDASPNLSFSDQLDLSEKGKGLIQLPLPINIKRPLRLRLNTEITDINQQTITTSDLLYLHSSDFYLGMQFPSERLISDQAFTLNLTSLAQDGSPYTQPISAKLKVERIIWNTVKVRGAGGTISHRNQKQIVPVLEEDLKVTISQHPQTGTPLPATTQLKLEQAGDYLFTLSSTDTQGRPVVSKQELSVYGEKQSPNWSRHDGARIDVISDKGTYQAGETAKLLVKSPITGHALISVERKGIRRVFTREITQQQSIIDIPITQQDAPNIFVSVLIIRGLEDSTHQHRKTDYRLGYAQLSVADPTSELSITLTSPESTVRPGDKIKLSALISDHQNKPLANTEVTLYAVDEGVLSLTGYNTPDPLSLFHAPFPLSVFTGQSISALLPENPDDHDFGNKGYVIGGGGEGGNQGLTRIRKNFKALAYWGGSLITDAQGMVRASFIAPDNLSEYRIIAIAHHGNRFASATNKMVIQKPLIIEPSLPNFGNVGDQIDLTAVLHNNSDKALDLEVSLTLDSHAQFRKTPATTIPTSSPLTPEAQAPASKTLKLHLAAGQTRSLKFPIHFTSIGDARWIWRARALNDDKLSDQTQSTLPVHYPIPLLRHSHRQTLHPAGNDKPAINLLADVDPELLNGQGSIQVTFSNSRMIEALDAVDYLLKYPYGCVEQTSSSTLPWLSTQSFQSALPSLNRSPEEIAAAIDHGSKRLLSMQTRDGGLAYWPGSSDSILWGSAYGGMILALAEKSGTELPKQSLQNLWEYLSKNLRNSGKIKDAYSLSQRCLVTYTLALAGHPENSYHDLLYQKRHQLPNEARALLALAMLESDFSQINQSRAAILLKPDTSKEPTPQSQVSWYGKPYTLATQLLAWSKLQAGGAQADQLAEQLLQLKNGPHVWGSTYNNAWPMLAIAQYSLSTPPPKNGLNFQAHFDQQNQAISLDSKPSSKQIAFPFNSHNKHPQLKVTQAAPSRIYAQVEVTSQPKLLPFKARDRGFSLRRNYQRIENDGTLSPAQNLKVGDLILVSLHANIDDKQHYLAIEDRLPSIFEAINPEFKSQSTQSAQHGKWKRLWPNHTEIKKDRVLFFQDYLYKGGDYVIQYLARVISPGSATAPPAKIEAMYEPQRYGLSSTQILTAQAVHPASPAPTPSTIATR